ncbi:MAG: hypothetical protein ACAH83_11285 [Alphaproteobacteria bacterium]
MTKESSLSPPLPTHEQYKTAPKFTVPQLLACIPAYEAFKTSHVPHDKFPYVVRVVETEESIYVAFGPDHEKIQGSLKGGGITYVINKKDNVIISTMVSK